MNGYLLIDKHKCNTFIVRSISGESSITPGKLQELWSEAKTVAEKLKQEIETHLKERNVSNGSNTDIQFHNDS